MKNLFTLCLLLSLGLAARAENNGLIVDAEARGYSVTVTDLSFGSTGLMLFKQGVRVALSNILKNGKSVPAVDMNGPDRDSKIRAQVNQLCIDMFGTEYRLENYTISGAGNSYGSNIDSIECLFTQRAK